MPFLVDPLLCPKCQGPMKVISFIEDGELFKKISVHLDTYSHMPPVDDGTQ